MKSALFGARAYAELVPLQRMEDLIARLDQTIYAREIEAALARYAGPRVVMEACRMHLANTYRLIRGFFAADGARLVAIVLARWDLFNLTAIVRGQVARARPDEILDALVPAGVLGEQALRTLVRQADPLATLDLVHMWDERYGHAARAAIARFETTRDWSAAEAALDAAFYARLLGSLKPGAENDELVRELLEREIDAANLLAALRLRGTAAALPAALAERCLPGGTLPLGWLAELASAARDDDVLGALRASKFGAALAAAGTLDPNRMQDALDRDLARFGAGFFARDPLTIATAIGFITAKRVEVSNVRLVAQGIALGMGQAEIEDALIMV